MTGHHHRPDEPSVRLVHVRDETAWTDPPDDPWPTEASIVPVRASDEADAENWTIRPKNPPSGDDIDTPALEPEPAWYRGDDLAFVHSGPLAPAGHLEDDGRSRRFLALGLAGMIYVVGIAGLWSMVQTFDRTMPQPLTPAGDNKAMPPLERTIDLRDAKLDDGHFVPKRKPAPPLDTGEDVAVHDLQKPG